jgi:hypothetical protein
MSIVVHKDAALFTLSATTPEYVLTPPSGQRILYSYVRTFAANKPGKELLGDSSHEWDSSGQTSATYSYPVLPYGDYYILWVHHEV